MKTLLSISIPLLLATGCVYSHRNPAVVYTEPVTPTTVVTPATPAVVAPASERPVVRVYQEAPTVVGTAAPAIVTEAAPSAVVTESPLRTVSSSDLALAETIRKMLLADPGLASAARSVRFSVLNRDIVMTGTTVTEHDRSILHSSIAGMPGVDHVEDKVQVDLSR